MYIQSLESVQRHTGNYILSERLLPMASMSQSLDLPCQKEHLQTDYHVNGKLHIFSSPVSMILWNFFARMTTSAMELIQEMDILLNFKLELIDLYKFSFSPSILLSNGIPYPSVIIPWPTLN